MHKNIQENEKQTNKHEHKEDHTLPEIKIINNPMIIKIIWYSVEKEIKEINVMD